MKMIDRTELISKTKKHSWWIESTSGGIQVAELLYKCFIDPGKLLGTGLLSFFFLSYKKWHNI